MFLLEFMYKVNENPLYSAMNQNHCHQQMNQLHGILMASKILSYQQMNWNESNYT